MKDNGRAVDGGRRAFDCGCGKQRKDRGILGRGAMTIYIIPR